MECPITSASSQWPSSMGAGTTIDGGAPQLFLDAGRVLMLWGWAALTAASASAAGRKNDDDDGRPDTSSAVHALLAFVVWLVGVSLVALVHVERRRFPRAARVGAAAANAVIDCFFVRPWN
jgi:hypothetical protein